MMDVALSFILICSASSTVQDDQVPSLSLIQKLATRLVSQSQQSMQQYVKLHGRCEAFSREQAWCPESNPSCAQGMETQKDPASGSVEACSQKCDSLGGNCVGFSFGGDSGKASYCTTFEGQCVDSNDGINNGRQHYFKKLAPYTTLEGSCGATRHHGWCADNNADCYGQKPKPGDKVHMSSSVDKAAYSSVSSCKDKCDKLGPNCAGLTWLPAGKKPSVCVTFNKCVEKGPSGNGSVSFYKKRYTKLVGYCKGVDHFYGWCPEDHPQCTKGTTSRVDKVASSSSEACADKCDSLGAACTSFVYGGVRVGGGKTANACITYEGKCKDSGKAVRNSKMEFFAKV